MNVPLNDLAFQHREIEAELEPMFSSIIANTSFILGPEVAEFERDYADYCGVSHCIGVASGTDALELSLRALDIGAGDEVLLPANTFIASALAVLRAGATPVLVDVDEATLLAEATHYEPKIGPATKAIMAVDLFGLMPDLDALEKLAESAGIFLIEDAAQSQGARLGERRGGAFGSIAGTSFYPGKNLGAYGDAGAVMTSDAALADRVRRLRNYGSEVRYEHPEIGFNSRLDTLQAAVLLAKLRRLDVWNETRTVCAERYGSLLADRPDVVLLSPADGTTPVWHLYPIRVPNRDAVLAALQEGGVGAAIHYPIPLPLQGAMSFLGHHSGDFPVTESAAAGMISLPMHPGLTEQQQVFVVDVLTAAMG